MTAPAVFVFAFKFCENKLNKALYEEHTKLKIFVLVDGMWREFLRN